MNSLRGVSPMAWSNARQQGVEQTPKQYIPNDGNEETPTSEFPVRSPQRPMQHNGTSKAITHILLLMGDPLGLKLLIC